MIRITAIAFIAFVMLNVVVGSSSQVHAGPAITVRGEPIPPNPMRTFATVQPVSPGSKVMLNPQPLPPKISSSTLALGGKVMLNPQPLPPRIAAR